MEQPSKNLLQINKPLVPLKVTLFLNSGIKSGVQVFLGLYLLQVGLTLEQITIIYNVAAVFQFLGLAASGVFMEKVKDPKRILYVNLWISVVFANLYLILPYTKSNSLNGYKVSPQCVRYQNKGTGENTTADNALARLSIELENCTLKLENYTDISTTSDFCLNSTFCSETNSSGNLAESFRCCYDHIDNESIPNCKICNSSVELISDKYENINSNIWLFILSMVITILYKTTAQNFTSYFDFIAVSMAKQHNSDYGRQIFWFFLGQIILPPLMGLIIGTLAGKMQMNYSVCFFILDASIAVIAWGTYKLNVEVKSERKGNTGKHFLKLFQHRDIIIFILMILSFSVTFGFRIEFVPIYLDELKASSLLIGLLTSMQGLPGLPFLFTSDWWINKIGSENLLLCAFFAYGLCYAGYSLIINPWWSLLLEFTSISNFHLMWVSAIRRCSEISTPELRSALQSVLVIIHFGFCRISGSLIGGVIMNAYGGRVSCCVLAIISFSSGLLYLLYRCFKHVGTGTKGNYKVQSLKSKDKEIKSPEVFIIKKQDAFVK